MNLRFGFSISAKTKKTIEILIRTALNLWVVWGSITILILPSNL